MRPSRSPFRLGRGAWFMPLAKSFHARFLVQGF
jgi:hypothetical protein